nr:zinc finger, CCHC-type [Tanacetum cinerariifolium]
RRDLRFGGCSTQLQAGPGKILECSCVGNERENKPKPQANKKDKSKGKTDKKKKVVPYQPKPKHNPLKTKENPNKDQTCHHCHVSGHWKRNCPIYLEELRKNKDKAEHDAAASRI